jgi:hypothetical protein
MSIDYTVGYRRPPANRQFKRGQSGNPNGRPKGHRNLRTDLLDELAFTEVVSGPDGEAAVSRQRLIVRRLVERALRADHKAATLLLTLVLKLSIGSDEDVDDAESDQAIIDGFVEQEIARRDRKARPR